MATVRVIDPVAKAQRKRRVGVYVRVSTDSSDQQNSYAAQIGHYTTLIEKRPDWELVDVYADADAPYGLNPNRHKMPLGSR